MADVNLFTYLSQDESNYYVTNGEGVKTSINKRRAIPETYPREYSGELKSAFNLLRLQLLGFFTSGFLTLVVFPALLTKVKEVGEEERKESLNILYSSITLLLIGIILSVILVIHIFY